MAVGDDGIPGPGLSAGAERPTVVVLRALGLGDLLTSVPALRALANAFPAHRRVLAAPPGLAPLASASGAVDEVVPTGELEPLDRSLHGADVAVNLHGRGPRSTVLLRQSRPRRLIAFGLPAGPAWRPGEHEVARWCRLLREHGIPADPARLDLDAARLPAAPAAARRATVVHPGAASGARRWPAKRFGAVAAAEARAGRQVIVTGGPGEAGLAARVAALAGLPGSASLAGRTDLAQLAAIVGAAGRVVCGDTGVAHLATALGTPSVVLFGPTSPREWGPPPERQDRHLLLWAGHTGDPHAHAPHSGLLEIGVEDVVTALRMLPPRDGQAAHAAA